MHLFTSIYIRQCGRNPCFLDRKDQPLPLVQMFFSFCSAGRLSCGFSEEIITRIGSTSRIPADALHQNYSSICHRDTSVGRFLFQAKTTAGDFTYYFTLCSLWFEQKKYPAYSALHDIWLNSSDCLCAIYWR